MDDIEYQNERRELMSRDKFRLGRKVVQTRDWYGTAKGLVGWVTDTWPVTAIAWEDGTEEWVSWAHGEHIDALDEYADLNEVRRHIAETAKKRRVERKQ